ncbi:hypothetical protein KUTeg_016335 [Tegillarca granosa]|uniref:Uncharacterized protein n=1 Tax=Tegillarca granosa TaxID=220873 RepID=A0ABQ9EQV2_TEGGR|nr:hypothetical protein KUTeg_016335 [Tegillarca granosa]
METSQKPKKTQKKKLENDYVNEPQINHEFEFFYGKDSPFSQFHSVEFTVSDVKYTCTEQFMMHSKAGKVVYKFL